MTLTTSFAQYRRSVRAGDSYEMVGLVSRHGGYRRVQAAGTKSETSDPSPAIHRLGATTIFSPRGSSHAPHQLKELLATTWCLQRLISRRSSAARSWFPSTKDVGASRPKCILH